MPTQSILDVVHCAAFTFDGWHCNGDLSMNAPTGVADLVTCEACLDLMVPSSKDIVVFRCCGVMIQATRVKWVGQAREGFGCCPADGMGTEYWSTLADVQAEK